MEDSQETPSSYLDDRRSLGRGNKLTEQLPTAVYMCTWRINTHSFISVFASSIIYTAHAFVFFLTTQICHTYTHTPMWKLFFTTRDTLSKINICFQDFFVFPLRADGVGTSHKANHPNIKDS